MKHLDFRIARVDELLPGDFAFTAALAELPDWRRRKCESLKFAADRRRSVAVWLLLKELLAKRGFDASALEVVQSDNGKPSFKDIPGLYFSLSHAESRVMAAVADFPVGCDIEKVAPIRKDVAEAVLTPAELKSGDFYRLWVRKESYVKALGTGISFDLKSISVLPEDSPAGVEFSDFTLSDGYVASIAALTVV